MREAARMRGEVGAGECVSPRSRSMPSPCEDGDDEDEEDDERITHLVERDVAPAVGVLVHLGREVVVLGCGRLDERVPVCTLLGGGGVGVGG